jgi:hypothetical protein
MNQINPSIPSTAIACALFCFGSSEASELRLSCDQSNNQDARMAARYIHTSTRALFDISFKAPASTSFDAREALEVRVDGYVVGYANLTVREGGNFGASLSFDSYSNNGNARSGSSTPFPASWPGSLPPQPVGIAAGSRVMIGSLGCTLGT